MDADSPFADEHPRLRPEDAPEVHVGPEVTDEQIEQVDNLHDAEDAADQAEGDAALDAIAAAHDQGTVDASIPGAEAPLDQTLTHCRCEKCGTVAKWTGPLTPHMLEQTFTRGVDEASGLPNCVHCGSAMVAVNFLKAEEAISQAAERLDAERAGDAAKPMHQPSIPGIHPPFDWRRAQLRTEALESSVESAENAWDEAKEVAADCKKTFDAAVDQLRKHIQETHRARVDAEPPPSPR